jgi:cell pole-organizing protein PopZ
MTDQIASEPSMDDILASIRRIITEDPPAVETTGGGGQTVPKAMAAPTPDTGPLSPEPEPAHEPLVGEHAATQTASAFESLAATADEAAKSRSTVALPAPGRTLEDLTGDLLRPLLKAWLDEHLPEIVRARVDEEVARITRSRVR